ncbi:MAG: YabP/YqfC family sporulation protein [Clostridia bacterium]|nr:YabP/YqfC family sporulation protein [Clostridia bacterium]
MNLIEQLLAQIGADGSAAFTVCIGEYAYFKGVKGVATLSSQKITLIIGKNLLAVTGENLSVAEYFQGDLIIKGGICGVQIEKSE